MAKPTYEQAKLQLRIYEERREPLLRQAREWFFKNYFADTLEEGMRIAPMFSQEGAFFMMVCSYWEQACSFLNNDLLHEDLFFENNGEFFGVWERVKNHAEEGRKRFANKLFLAEMEKAAQRYEKWIEARSPGHVAAMRKFMEDFRAQTLKAA